MTQQITTYHTLSPADVETTENQVTHVYLQNIPYSPMLMQFFGVDILDNQVVRQLHTLPYIIVRMFVNVFACELVCPLLKYPQEYDNQISFFDIARLVIHTYKFYTDDAVFLFG